MATTTMRYASTDTQRAGDTVSRPELEPIYAELARRWEGAGRHVPGRDDEEWIILVDRCPWPGR